MAGRVLDARNADSLTSRTKYKVRKESEKRKIPFLLINHSSHLHLFKVEITPLGLISVLIKLETDNTKQTRLWWTWQKRTGKLTSQTKLKLDTWWDSTMQTPGAGILKLVTLFQL